MLTWWPALAILTSLLSFISLILYFIKKSKNLALKILKITAMIFPLLMAYPFLWVWLNNPSDKSGLMLHLIVIVLMAPLMILSWIALGMNSRKKAQ
jgi:asparagine N-glycosylation enzyme membrane subunit Stt3